MSGLRFSGIGFDEVNSSGSGTSIDISIAWGESDDSFDAWGTSLVPGPPKESDLARCDWAGLELMEIIS